MQLLILIAFLAGLATAMPAGTTTPIITATSTIASLYTPSSTASSCNKRDITGTCVTDDTPNVADLQCPGGNGVTEQSDHGGMYELLCDTMVLSTDPITMVLSNGGTSMDAETCVWSCDGDDGCCGAWLNEEGSCTIMGGPLMGECWTMAFPGYQSYVRKF